LHMEAEDCIVCDKCARICPVDCIDIEGIRATESLGYTSDGSNKRLHLAQFDIDMAKCCYCGLCTTVCPTECLTMTKVYDYSEFDIRDFIYHYGILSPEEAEAKRQELEEQKRLKAKTSVKEPRSKPTLKPKMKLPIKPKSSPTKPDSTADKP
ncbi:MAG: 4Fe-4S binding protein, partial [Bacteroidota bacterium]